MLVVISPKVGSSFKKVPERSITGISGRVLLTFAGALATGSLFFETTLAELDFVAIIKEPRWRGARGSLPIISIYVLHTNMINAIIWMFRSVCLLLPRR